MNDILDRHQRIALQLSGGKDSVACLWLLRPYLDRITVYHLNAGDQPPETAGVIAECRTIIPHFVEIKTDSRQWAAINGFPSDVVPTFSSPMGRVTGFGSLPLADRFSCCWANLMEPMYRRMKADGMTLIIRGQKTADMPTVPLKSGSVNDGFEFFYPIEDWNDDQVLAYLRGAGAPVSSAYDVLKDGVECLHCTAWWDHRNLDWTRTAHPEAAAWVSKKHGEIKIAVMRQMECI